jgi:hypothetical protein
MSTAEANVKPIRIMLKTNINGQKEDVPFTKALLSHPDYPGLSDTEGFNEYPYICDNVSIPISLNSASYFERVQFFFDKDKFRSLTGNMQFVTDDNQKPIILTTNVKTMLELLFLTAIPVSGNVKDSFEMNIKSGPWIPNLKFNKESAMELLNTYYFSYLKIGGNEYTVNRIVWLNDVINNPDYSKLFGDFETFSTWSIGILNKLLARKKQLYVEMADACKNELSDKLTKAAVVGRGRAPASNRFGDTVYGDIYKNITPKLKKVVEIATRRSARIAAIAAAGAGAGSAALYGSDIDETRRSKITKDILEELRRDYITLGKLGWQISSSPSLVGIGDFDPDDIDAAIAASTDPADPASAVAAKKIVEDELTAAGTNASKFKKNYEECKTASRKQIDNIEDLKKKHSEIQGYINNLKISRINVLIDIINDEDRSVLPGNVIKFAKKLLKMNTENDDDIVAIVDRIINNTGNQPVSSKYQYLNDISEKMRKFTSDNRELLGKDSSVKPKIQKLIDDYVYKVSDGKQNIEAFIKRISTFKKNPGSIPNKDELHIGVVEFRNDDPKLPTYEIIVQCDVFGGRLDATNIRSARCIFKDKKLTTRFNNIRRNIKTNKLKVMPGPYFDLKDIKPEPKPKETVKQRPVPVKGGRRTLKRRRSFKRR